jgi:hypothetical protein
MLGDPDAITTAVERIEDPIIKSLWDDLAKLSHSEWLRQASPTINRLFRIVQSKAIQRLMCVQMEGHNLELTFKDTILVNLAASGNLDADAAKTIGALLLNEFYQSAKRRKGRNGKDPAPYFLYVDEWCQIPSPDFGRILAETRKFGLLLVLAGQDLSQVRSAFGEGFQKSLLTLCQVQCSFGGLNQTDAGRLAKEWRAAQHVLELAPRQCIVKLPHQSAQVVDVPEVRSPFLREERLAEFEEEIARANGALPVEEVDALLESFDSPSRELGAEDFIR